MHMFPPGILLLRATHCAVEMHAHAGVAGGRGSRASRQPQVLIVGDEDVIYALAQALLA